MTDDARLDEFFGGATESRGIFEVLREAVESIGPFEMRVSKSQVAFRRRLNFALAWMPEQYLRGDRRSRLAPLVLAVSFPERDPSLRWKSVVEAAPGRFTHHLELFSAADIDDQVREWLREAWEAAG